MASTGSMSFEQEDICLSYSLILAITRYARGRRKRLLSIWHTYQFTHHIMHLFACNEVMSVH